MKDPIEFSKTIYLGDRACKRIVIDGWNKSVSLEVDTISRIRDPSGDWKFYTEEDIQDGRIVFDHVQSYTIEPQGSLPNDWIDLVDVSTLPTGCNDRSALYRFTISLGAVDKNGAVSELTMHIIAQSLHLEDPKKLGVFITD